MIDIQMAESTRKTSGKPPVVLVVEDEPLVRMVAVEYLASLGYSVLEAGGAEEAIDALMDHPVDLVFSDVQMPGIMDGNELAEWIEINFPNVPVVLTSGKSVDLGHGVGGLLRKPYYFETLKGRIDQALLTPPRRGSDPVW